MDKLLSFTPEPFPELDREAEYDELDPLADEWEMEEVEEEARRGRRPRSSAKAPRRSVTKPKMRPRAPSRATGLRVKPLRQRPKLMPRPLPMPALRAVAIPFIPPLRIMRPDLEPTPPPDVQRPEESRRTEQAGSEGSGSPPPAQPSEEPASEHVRWVQDCLNRALGLQLTVDGVMGRETRSAVRMFQERRGFSITGLVEPATEASLRIACTQSAPHGSRMNSSHEGEQKRHQTAMEPENDPGKLAVSVPVFERSLQENETREASDSPPSGNKPPPLGYRKARISPVVRRKADEIVMDPAKYPMGTQVSLRIDGKNYLFAVEWHKHKSSDPVKESLKRWHRGVTVYEAIGSATLLRFFGAISSGDWKQAFHNLNGLSMYEMLRALDNLPRQRREELMSHGRRYRLMVNMPRIEYAMAVVTIRQLPPDAPGDLAATGQVQTAREFLRRALPAQFDSVSHGPGRPDQVRWIQETLNRILGLQLAVDGSPGSQTRSAIRTFQRQQGLVTDGIVGPKTEAALVQRSTVEQGAISKELPNSSTALPIDLEMTSESQSRWVLPPEVISAGETQFVRYDPPGPQCSGSNTPGVSELATYVKTKFPGVRKVETYNCRQSTGKSRGLSLHAVGRALDIFPEGLGVSANSSIGDPIANWLVKNAADIGVQHIIWNRVSWRGSAGSPKHRPYTGLYPHTDHIHVELNLDSAQRKTAWFREFGYIPSAVRTRFEEAILTSDWKQAFRNLNGLSMYEMLRALDNLQRQRREELMSHGHQYRLMVNMPRIEYAMAVVTTRQLPPDAPGDLAATGQVQTAREFLRRALPAQFDSVSHGPGRPDQVRWIQETLNRILGLQLAVDGIPGSQTRSAIRTFQRQQGLVTDGIVGPKTEAALLKTEKRYTELTKELELCQEGLKQGSRGHRYWSCRNGFTKQVLQ